MSHSFWNRNLALFNDSLHLIKISLCLYLTVIVFRLRDPIFRKYRLQSLMIWGMNCLRCNCCWIRHAQTSLHQSKISHISDINTLGNKTVLRFFAIHCCRRYCNFLLFLRASERTELSQLFTMAHSWQKLTIQENVLGILLQLNRWNELDLIYFLSDRLLLLTCFL